MGKITEALKKVADERVERIQKKPEIQYVAKKVENTAVDQHVIAFHDSGSPVGEQFKILRTNIQSLRHEKNLKSFVITSAIDGEGKTITSLNLAITMADDLRCKETGICKPVLLIDTDMRRGKVAKYLGLKPEAGLSEFLQGKVESSSVFINPGIPNLTIIPAGKRPKNPSELLNSKKMEQLLAMLKTKFDYIFIDTPLVVPIDISM